MASRPASSARIFALIDGTRAGPAADGAIALLDQRMARQVVLVQPGLDVVGVPVGQRIDPQHPVQHLERFQLRPRRGLIAFAPGDDGVEPGRRPRQGSDLAQVAAGVGIRLPKVVAGVQRRLLARIRRDQPHVGQAQGLGQLGAIGQGLEEMLARLQEDHRHVLVLAGDDVQQGGGLGAEGRDGADPQTQRRVKRRLHDLGRVLARRLAVQPIRQRVQIAVVRRRTTPLPDGRRGIDGGLIGGAERLIHPVPSRGVGAGRQFDRVEARAPQMPRLIRQHLARRDQTPAIAPLAQHRRQREAAPVAEGLELQHQGVFMGGGRLDRLQWGRDGQAQPVLNAFKPLHRASHRWRRGRDRVRRDAPCR